MGEDRCAVDVRFTGIFGKNEKNRISKLHCFEVLFFSAEFALLLFAPVCSRAMTIAFGLSAVYPVAGKDALRVVVLHIAHFSNKVGRIDQCLRNMPEGPYKADHYRY